MFGTMDITVIRRTNQGVDSHGNITYVEIPETVSNVSVRPQNTVTQRDGKAQEYAIETTLALAFPKTYTRSLRGCFVIVPIYPDIRWEIQGEPLATPDAPTAWNRNATAVMCDG